MGSMGGLCRRRNGRSYAIQNYQTISNVVSRVRACVAPEEMELVFGDGEDSVSWKANIEKDYKKRHKRK